MTHTTVTLITELRDAGHAGEVTSAGAMSILADRLDGVLTGKFKSIDEALNWSPAVIRVHRAAEIGRLLVQIADASDGAREAARTAEQQLRRYAATRFAGDQKAGGARSDKDVGLYRLMTMFQGRIPNADALRKAKDRYLTAT